MDNHLNINNGTLQISELFQRHVITILSNLEFPKRYVDLEFCCPNESTRTKKLRQLQECGLIKTESIKTDGRSHIHYCLTKKGEKVLELLNEICKITNGD